MTSDDRRTSRMQHVTTTGSALAVVLLPLAAGMLLARSVGADPMTSVNALITTGAQRARLSPLPPLSPRRLRAARPKRATRPARPARPMGLTRPKRTRRPLRELSVLRGR
ncbi:hypothetical protein Q5762_11970 [Streptomyces sp. P9(2023)]|uniref:hypothetical protein n=1 Tax=Streptomyces sp. P9(2023) TaxID=3064394 RepID=UPI0028F4032A|nr:hypothetical protein [Streptomyces sp. P9(2023)]MDT9689045.1 hypothetical protein [Streptomyces sp. P9(2023)]